MNCYETIDRMGDALEGALAAELRGGFDEHLEECAACRNYLDQLRATVQALERLPLPAASAQRRAELIAAFHRERSTEQ
jgi:predicted anti-sigma-YlaC factor YlaD